MKLEERGELINSFESGVMREIAASARRFSAALGRAYKKWR